MSDVDGMFPPKKGNDYSDVIDGASNTLLIGERSNDLIAASWLGVVQYSANSEWYIGSTTQFAPNSTPPRNIYPFGSMHSGVTILSLVDGSVHNISDEIDQSSFAAMGSIDGRETVSEF